jgi:hypothetical protein
LLVPRRDSHRGYAPGPVRQLFLALAKAIPLEVIDAVGALEPVWDELYPAEQARILRLLIERVDVAPDGIAVTLHAAGIRSLVAELASENAVPDHDSILEAAE